MKKIVFAVYLLTVVIMFPLYTIVELSNGDKKLNHSRYSDPATVMEKEPSNSLSIDRNLSSRNQVFFVVESKSGASDN
jgi:hypothetical protein